MYWGAGSDGKVYFCRFTLEYAKRNQCLQVEFSNHSSVQRIILFQSMTSQTTPMVTSLWRHRILHPGGLVPNLLRLRCQCLGDWSQRMASLTSESDSIIFAGNIMYHTIFQSHYGHNSRLSEFSSTRGATSRIWWLRGSCPLFFYLWLFVNSLSSPVDGYSERRWPISNVGVYSCISIKASSSNLLYSVVRWLSE